MGPQFPIALNGEKNAAGSCLLHPPISRGTVCIDQRVPAFRLGPEQPDLEHRCCRGARNVNTSRPSHRYFSSSAQLQDRRSTGNLEWYKAKLQSEKSEPTGLWWEVNRSEYLPAWEDAQYSNKDPLVGKAP